MEVEKIFSWVACVLVVSGIAMIGHKQKYGFIIISVGGVITGVLVYMAGLPGLVIQNLIAVATNIYSFWRWKRHD